MKKYFKENYSGTEYGMQSKKAKETKAYVARGKTIADNAMFNAEVQEDEIAYSIVNLDSDCPQKPPKKRNK